MKGMVFTEFIEFVEDKFGFEVSDHIISNSDLKSGGVYTAVGTYDFQEMVNLLISLSEKINVEIPQLLEVFGNHLFYRFVELYPDFIQKSTSLFDFIDKIDQYIHVEVKKLYPDAELPKIIVNKRTEDFMDMTYKSERKLGNFAFGLLSAASDYFEVPLDIEMNSISADGSEVQFFLKKK
jgi:hypothetical protein